MALWDVGKRRRDRRRRYEAQEQLMAEAEWMLGQMGIARERAQRLVDQIQEQGAGRRTGGQQQ